MSDAPASPKGLRRRIELLPLHPFLLGAHSILALYAANANRLLLADTGPLLGGVLIAIGTVLAGIYTICRDWTKAAILTSVLAVAALYYGPLADATLGVADFPGLAKALPAIIWTMGMAVLLVWLMRSKFDLRMLSVAFNLMALVMVCMTALAIAHSRYTDAVSLSQEIVHTHASLPAGEPASAGTQRDIYYLIFDRYANAETLEDVYHFDNTPFLHELRKQGFYVAADSASNYQRTAHSLASSLSLDYLDWLTELLGTESSSWLPLYTMLQDHAVGRFLKARGYKFIQIGSWWNPTRENPLADVNINWHATPELWRVYFLQTAVGKIACGLGVRYFDDRVRQYERIHREFDQLAEVARDPEPTFVFAHLLIPHPPFVFGPDGACLDLQTVANRSRTENYLNQVRYVNSEILEKVRAIRANSKTEPIIVIQSDEGPWPAPYAGDERFLGGDVTPVDWTRVNRAQLREKMRILNALYLPGPGTSRLYPEMTPVNTFRIVFNRYFGTDFPLLPDESYVFLNDRQLYAFRRVTPLVRGSVAAFPMTSGRRGPQGLLSRCAP